MIGDHGVSRFLNARNRERKSLDQKPQTQTGPIVEKGESRRPRWAFSQISPSSRWQLGLSLNWIVVIAGAGTKLGGSPGQALGEAIHDGFKREASYAGSQLSQAC
ncbi:hypothetical protein PG989_004783 [Apiospora arundinis]